MKNIMQFSYLSNRLCFDFFNISYKDKFNARNEIIRLCVEEGMIIDVEMMLNLELHLRLSGLK